MSIPNKREALLTSAQSARRPSKRTFNDLVDEGNALARALEKFRKKSSQLTVLIPITSHLQQTIVNLLLDSMKLEQNSPWKTG